MRDKQGSALIRIIATAVMAIAITLPLLSQTGPGSALQLNGANQYVNLGNSSTFNLTGGLTVEAWIKVEAFNQDWTAVVTKGDQTWRLHRNQGTNVMGFGTNHTIAAIPNDLEGSTNVNDGKWHHVAAVYDSTNSVKYLYVDGILDASVSTSGVLRTDSRAVYIGENSEQSNRLFDGTIDEVRIWKTARTAAQIRENMHRSIDAASESQLVAYYKLDAGSGSTAADSKGTNPGTILNSPPWVASTIQLSDSTTVSSVTGFNGAQVTLGNVDLNFSDQFDLSSDIVVHEIPVDPNLYPVDETVFQGNRYWVVSVYGSPGTFSADMILSYPLGELASEDAAKFSLYRRLTGDDGAWTEAVPSASSISATTVSFNGVTAFGQTSVSLNTMIYVSSTTTQNELGLISGMNAEHVIGIEVQVGGSADPLNATEFNLGATGTSLADVSNARLFYTGTSSDFDTTSQFGSTVINPGPSFSITGSQTLASGTNYFWLAFDISALAPAGNLIDAECSLITLGGVARTPLVTSPSGSRQLVFTEIAGSAIDLDGVDQYVDLGSSSVFDLTSGFTIEAWIKVDSFGPDWQALVTKGDFTWRLHRNVNTNVLGFGTNHGISGVANDIQGTTNVNDGRWHHIAAVYDSLNSMKYLYVDGHLDASSATSDVLRTDSFPVFIGENSQVTDRLFDGLIDEVRIWNVARPASDIRASMHTTLTGNEAGLLTYLQFNEQAGGAFDRVGGHHGAIENGAVRIVSTVPLGPASVSSVSAFNGAELTLGSMDLSFTNTFDLPVDVVVHELPQVPNAYPSSSTGFQGSRYWIVYAYGTPGAFSADVTLTYPPGELDSASLSDFNLYRRSTGGVGSWTTAVSGASGLTSTSISFDGVTSFGEISVASHAMSFESATTAQESQNVLSGRTNQNVLEIRVITGGTSSPLQITEFEMNAAGTTSLADISNARLFSTGTNGTFSASVQFGSTVTSPSGTFNFTGSQSLADGTNHFWLTYDISATASAGAVIDAECTEIVVDGIPRIPTVTAPAGAPAVLDHVNRGSALAVNGGSQYVEVPDNASLDLTTFYTLEAWIKPTSFGFLDGIISKYQSNGADGYFIRLTGSEPYTGIGFDGQETANGILTAGQWYHIAAVNSFGTRKLYINGQEVALLGSPMTVQSNSDPLRIGVDFAERYFDGSIEEVRVWNIARSEGEIQESMHRTLDGTEIGLVAYWQFNESSGAAVDAAGSHSGTLYNSAGRSVSTAPIGSTGALVTSGTQSAVGPSGGQIQVTITSTPDANNYLGVYQFGSLTGAFTSAGETFESPIVERSELNWGIAEFGAITANMTFDYSSIDGIVNPLKVQIVTRDNATDDSWVKVTPSSRDNLAKTITINGATSFGEYALGVEAGAFPVLSVPGYALQFDGVDDYVDLGSDPSPVSGLSSITVETWVKPVSFANGVRLLEKEDEWYFYQGTASDFRWTIHGDASNFVSTGALSSNQWYHVAGTYDGSTYRIYVNGELRDSRSYATGIQNSVYPLTVGARRSAGGAATSFFSGVVDEVRIWSVAKSVDEIRESMHSTLGGFEESLVVYLQFNEGAGNTAGNIVSDNGTLVNGPVWLASGIPVGGGSSQSTTGFIAGSVSLGDVSIETIDAFDNAVDITAAVVETEPNVLPGLFVNVAGNKYFVISAFGTPGAFSVNLALDYGPGVLDSLVDLFPAAVKLYTRSTTSDGVWSLVASADSARSAAGVVYFSGVTTFSQFSVVEDESILPVQMGAFTAVANRIGAELFWRTDSEVENFGFEVERRSVGVYEGESVRGASWQSVGFVQGAGTSPSPKDYSFVDKPDQPGRYAYRVKQIDYSGSFAYTTALEVEIGLAPMEFSLGQNYPNPFNPSTTIEFTLPEDGWATLKIYDLQGREVATLVDEARKAGVYHQVFFDASPLASGLYFSRLQSGKLQTIKKMVFVK